MVKKSKLWFEEAEEKEDEGFGGIDKMFNKLMKGMISPMQFRMSIPSVKDANFRNFPIDISENEKELILRADLPGFKKEDIKLKVTSTTINIMAQKKNDTIDRRENFFRRERSLGMIQRGFKLPTEIKPELVRARMENGILRIELPKLIERKSKKEIRVE